MKPQNVLWVLAALFIGVFMENLDHTVMTTIMPTVVAKIGGMEYFYWVISVYLITSTIFIPIFGKLADQYGKKPFLIIGFATFIVSSALSANAETMGQLIAYRALQGLGAAPLMPIAFSLIFELVIPEKRGKMQGGLASVSTVSMLLGPMVGSLLAEHFSWQWVFWLNVPFGVAALLFIVTFYKEQRAIQPAFIDYKGAAALTLTIAPLMLGLEMGGKEYAWISWQTVSLFGLSGIFALLFLRIEIRAQEPIIALNMFNRKVFSSTVIGFLQGIVAIAVMNYIPFYIQGVMGGTASTVGTFGTYLVVAMMLGVGMGGHLLSRISARTIIFACILVISAGLFMLTGLDADTGKTYFTVAIALVGLGIGPLMPTTTLLAQTSVSKEHTTSVTSLVTFFRNIGTAIGTSLLAVIVNRQVSKSIDDILENPGYLSNKQAEWLQDPNIVVDLQLQALIPEQALHLLRQGLSTGIMQAFIVAIGAVWLMSVFGYMAGKERLAPSRERKQFKFH